jgi:hypothetical protein
MSCGPITWAWQNVCPAGVLGLTIKQSRSMLVRLSHPGLWGKSRILTPNPIVEALEPLMDCWRWKMNRMQSPPPELPKHLDYPNA